MRVFVTTVVTAILLLVSGCGGSKESTVTAEQAELKQWAAENPAPAVEVNPDA